VPGVHRADHTKAIDDARGVRQQFQLAVSGQLVMDSNCPASLPARCVCEVVTWTCAGTIPAARQRV
jgi:hypothetical protein